MAVALVAAARPVQARGAPAAPPGIVPRPDGTLPLSMDDALALSRAQGPELVAARLRVRASQGDALSAGLLANPTLSTAVGNFALGPTNPRGLSVGDTVVTQVGLTEELPLWGKRAHRMEAASDRAAQAEAERADVERRLDFDVRSTFTQLLAAEQRVRLAREARDGFADTVRLSEARRREGDIAPADLARIALEQRDFEREVAEAELDRRDATAKLLLLVGTDATDVEPIGTLAVPDAPHDVARLGDEALRRRPDLQAAEREANAADAALALARSEAWPSPTVGLVYTHSQFTVSGDLRDQIGATLSLPLPVFDRNQGGIERAEAEALAARHEVDRLRRAIPQEVRTAVTQYETASARARRFAEAFLQQAHEARASAEGSFREGATSTLELLDAERAFLQTQRDHLDALRDAATAAWDITQAAALESTP